MTANTFAGAASHSEVNWRTINWSAVHRNVRRLQARIVKATQEGRWGKVNSCGETGDGKPRQEDGWGR
jgi:RNA-directed DNA polymerase